MPQRLLRLYGPYSGLLGLLDKVGPIAPAVACASGFPAFPRYRLMVDTAPYYFTTSILRIVARPMDLKPFAGSCPRAAKNIAPITSIAERYIPIIQTFP